MTSPAGNPLNSQFPLASVEADCSAAVTVAPGIGVFLSPSLTVTVTETRYWNLRGFTRMRTKSTAYPSCPWVVGSSTRSFGAGLQQWKVFRQEIDRNQLADRSSLVKRVERLLKAGDASAIQARLEMRVEGRSLEVINENLKEHCIDSWRQSAYWEHDRLRHGILAAFAHGGIGRFLTRTQDAAGIAVTGEGMLNVVRWSHRRTQQHSIGAVR